MNLSTEELDLLAELLALELHDIAITPGKHKRNDEPVKVLRNKILLAYHNQSGHNLPENCNIGSGGL